jgi:polar amino acid transport system substrate-binding protein
MKRIFLVSLLALAAALAARSSPAQAAAPPTPAPTPAPTPREPSEVSYSPASPPDVPDDLQARIRRRGVLKVGVSDSMPWTMHDKDGKLVGFAVDVVERLAADLGVKAELVPVPPDLALADMTANRFDILFNRMSITPQRALVVDFSHPVVVSSVELIVNKQKAGSRKTLADFNAPDVTVGVRKGTRPDSRIRTMLPKARFQEFEDDAARIDALRAGKITAAVALTPISGVFSTRYPEITSPLAAPLTRRAQAFAVRPSDSDFLDYLNAWITYQTLDGWLGQRLEYWFKNLAWTADM